jgi:YVTN family beta-propeller protein
VCQALGLASVLAVTAGCSADAGGFAESAGSDTTSEDAAESEALSHANASPASAFASPIVLGPADRMVWAVNRDSDSVSVIDARSRTLVGKLAVGQSPVSVAVDPLGRFAYVANAGSNDLSVIDLGRAGPHGLSNASERRIVTGAAPASVVVAPDGRRVFVANGSQDTITVLSGRDQRLLGVLDLRQSACNADDPSRHFQPRGLAITADGSRLYVTRLLSFTRPGGAQRADDGKEGLVCRIDIDDGREVARYRTTPIRLAASDAGFADPNGKPTAAFPNQLQSIVLRDGHAYLPNIAASPSGPLHFDVDTQAYVNRVDDLATSERDGGALNLHLGARDPEPGKGKLFFANPSALAFTTRFGRGSAYVVSSGSDLLVKLEVDGSGALRFTQDDDTTRYIDLNDPADPDTSGENAGKNPIGIAIDRRGSTAYVLNYVSRNVSIVDLSSDRVTAVVRTEELPEPGSHDEVVLVGAELFFSSRGHFVRPEGVLGSVEDRLSDHGHQSCASCHADGLTDGVVWQFNSGPRKTIAINGTTDPSDRSRQRIINASAIFDELEDVDFNTRRVSNGEPLATALPCIDTTNSGALTSTNDPDHGLILGSESDYSRAACVLVPFTVPNEHRPQLRVELPGSGVLVNATDALKEWQRSAVKTPNRPLTARELAAAGLGTAGAGATGPGAENVLRGGRLFAAAGCASCHGGSQWTSKVKDFVSPPAAGEIASEAAVDGVNKAQYLYRFLTDVGTFELNVAGATNVMAGYPAIGGVETDTNELAALGFDYDGDGKGNGYNTPSLLGAFAAPPYFHNGACETLACVLADVSHRRAGQPEGRPDLLDDERARADLTLYLEAIDLGTRPQRKNP